MSEEEHGRAEQLKAATEALEAVVRDRGLLRALSLEERTRLLTAAGDVFNPDVVQRRRFNKTVRREKKAARLERDEAVLGETGIRTLRERPVFTTPNVYAPTGFEQVDVDSDPDLREVVEPQHCYVCKQDYSDIHPFYDQLCPPCGDFNYAKRGQTADLSGRVALLTGGRVKIGYQAGIKLLRAGAQLDRHDALPARLRRPVRRGARLRRVGRPARGLRPRPAAHAERRGVLPPPARDEGPARLHRQQRLPDRPAAGGLLPAHDGGRERVGRRDARPRPRGCSASTRGCGDRRSCRPPFPRSPATARSPSSG